MADPRGELEPSPRWVPGKARWRVRGRQPSTATSSPSREWHPAAESQGWIEALETCQARGPDWTLPRRSELALYLGSRPEAVRTWRGSAWTNASAERGGTHAVIVDVAPRKSGAWRYPADVGREASPCEANVRRTEPPDAFTGLRARICDATERSPLLHPSGMTVVTVRRGVRAEFLQAATICVKPPAEPRPAAWGRPYPQEREFSTAADFRSYVTDYCGTLTGRRPFICFVLAGDAPAFPEDGTEHLMRLACVDELNGKGCFGYAELMELRGEKDRAERYDTSVNVASSPAECSRRSGGSGSPFRRPPRTSAGSACGRPGNTRHTRR